MGPLEPFVDEHVGSVVVELLAHELAHGEARGHELGVVSRGHGCSRGRGVGAREDGRGREGEGVGDVKVEASLVFSKGERRRKQRVRPRL